MITLQQYRDQYPAYKQIDDDTLANALHKKYYSHLDIEDMKQRISHTQMQNMVQEVPRKLKGKRIPMKQDIAEAAAPAPKNNFKEILR